MRYTLLILSLTTLAMTTLAADLRIDHVTVAGRDLKKMQAALKAAGIPSEYGGPHSNHATEMALTSFPDGSYLELIAIQPTADPAAVEAHYWGKFLKADAGPAAWAVRPADFPAEVARLKATGTLVSQPSRSGRAKPDGTKLDWETAQVGPEPNGTFFPFMIRDFTPRELRTGKPATQAYTGVHTVIIGVKDLKAAIDRYRKAYALPAPSEREDMKLGAHVATFPGTPVALATPINAQSWLAKRLTQFGEGPVAFTLASPQSKFKEIEWLNSETLGWHLGAER